MSIIEDDENINWDEVAEVPDAGPIKGDIPPLITHHAKDVARAAMSIMDKLKALPKLNLPEAPPEPTISHEPIKLLEPDPPRLRVIEAGDMQIIASEDRIEFLRSGQQSELVAAAHTPPVVATPQAPRITDKTTAEMEVGRRNLARHALSSVVRPRPPAPPPDTVAILTPTNVPPAFQHLLNKPAVAGKGQGY